MLVFHRLPFLRNNLLETGSTPTVPSPKDAMTADLQRLTSDLAASDPITRTQVAEEISRLGPEAAPVAVALVKAAGDDAEEVREYAAAALEEMGPPAIGDIEPLAALLSDSAADVGYWAATLLGRLEANAAPAVPLLAAAVTGSTDMSVRQRAAWALGQIGPPAGPALDALKQAAASDDPRLVRLVQRAIEQISG
jgi:HEAT repeat protein